MNEKKKNPISRFFYKFVDAKYKGDYEYADRTDYSNCSLSVMKIHKEELNSMLNNEQRCLERTLHKAGVIISTNGIVLALICTFHSSTVETAYYVNWILITSIFLFVISSLLAAYVLISKWVFMLTPSDKVKEHVCNNDLKSYYTILIRHTTSAVFRYKDVNRHCAFFCANAILFTVLGMSCLGIALINGHFYSWAIIFVSAMLLALCAFISYKTYAIIYGFEQKKRFLTPLDTLRQITYSHNPL